MLRSKFLLTAILVLLALFSAPGTTEAAFTVTLGEGSSYQTLNDSANPGQISVQSLAFGDFTTSFVAATSNSSLNVTPAKLNLASLGLVNNSGTTQTITLTITDNAFTAPSGVSKTLVSSLAYTSLGFDANSTATLQNSIGTVNGSLVSLNGQNTTGSASAVDGPFSPTSGDYTITMVVKITLTAGAEFDGTAKAAVYAPAPPGVVMFASVLPFAGLLRIRRRLTKAEVATVA